MSNRRRGTDAGQQPEISTSGMEAGGDARAHLAQRLRQFRSTCGLSLRELERKVPASDSSLSRYLSGQVLPPWPVVATLCELAASSPTEVRELWERAHRTPASPDPAPPAGPTGENQPRDDELEDRADRVVGRRRRRRNILVLIIGIAIGLGIPPVVDLLSNLIFQATHRPSPPPPPNPLVHDNPASGPAGRFDYATDPYVRTKTQPGEFRMTLRDSPSGWLCLKLVDSKTGQTLGRPECVNNGETKVIADYIPAVTKFHVLAMSGAEGQYHGSMYY